MFGHKMQTLQKSLLGRGYFKCIAVSLVGLSQRITEHSCMKGNYHHIELPTFDPVLCSA